MTSRIARERVVRPQEVCFTQDSICVTFRKPRDKERIDDAVELIIDGRLSPKAFPKINVVEFQNKLWSLDNRRLWVFRKAEVNFITVTLVTYDSNSRFTTLSTTSPYLYEAMSRRSFFPRIRGHCKEHFTGTDDQDPAPFPFPRRLEKCSKIWMENSHAATPAAEPATPAKETRPHVPPYASTKSMHVSFDDEYLQHLPHSSALPPLHKKHSSRRPPLPVPKKRPHEAAVHPSSFPKEYSPSPAKKPCGKCRPSPPKNPEAPCPAKKKSPCAETPPPVAKRGKSHKATRNPKHFSYGFHFIRKKPATKKKVAAADLSRDPSHFPVRSPCLPRTPCKVDKLAAAPEPEPRLTPSKLDKQAAAEPGPAAPRTPFKVGMPVAAESEPSLRQTPSKLNKHAAAEAEPQLPLIPCKVEKQAPETPLPRTPSKVLAKQAAAAEPESRLHRTPSVVNNQAAAEPEPRLPRTPGNADKKAAAAAVPRPGRGRPRTVRDDSASKTKPAPSYAEPYVEAMRCIFEAKKNCHPPPAKTLKVLQPECIFSPLPSEKLLEKVHSVTAQQQQETRKTSVVECPVEYDVKGQLLGSSPHTLGSLPANPAAFNPEDSNVRRSKGADVLVTGVLDSHELQAAIPPASNSQALPLVSSSTKGSKVQETRCANTDSNASSQQQINPQEPIIHNERCRATYRQITSGLELRNVLPGNTRACTRRHQIKVQGVKKPKTRSTLKKGKDHRIESQPLSKQKSLKEPRSATTAIVPVGAARKSEARSGLNSKEINSGDMVYVKINGEVADRRTEGQGGSSFSSGKLQPRLMSVGPFEVKRKVNRFSVELELPEDCLLKPCVCLTVLSLSRPTTTQPRKGISIKLVPERIISKRVAVRFRTRKVCTYLVKWRSLPASEATWEQEIIFDDHPHLLAQYHSPMFSNPYLLRNLRILRA